MNQDMPPHEPPAEMPSSERWIGDYRLLRLLGDGGMGRVWLAQQTRPQRNVALKVVARATPELAARLRREIEALAALEHPNIARMYAAGEAAMDGVVLPWLAMEYVQGTDLLQYVQSRRSDLSVRLRLLVEVTRAVEYAHQQGIIHRDLKPGNILVDEDGHPRILDFGIAWRHGQSDPALTLAGQVLGTVPYISPEQLVRGDRSADVRSDVYSLGVIAYELIGGSLPHPRLATSTLIEALDILRREDPLPLAKLSPAARGDLETVVTKALASDPMQRYASADALADDLERVLEHRPVLARRPTLTYRATRFVRRHRALSSAAAIVFVTLTAASVVSLRFALAERAAHAEAAQRVSETAAVNAFLQRMLTSANPEATGGRNPTVAEVVTAAEHNLAGLAGHPAVERSVAATLASTRRALGDYPAALMLIDRALAADGSSPPQERQRLLHERSSILIELARFDEARAVLTTARAAWPDAPVGTRLNLALTATRADSDEGNFDAAVAGLRELLGQAAQLDPAALASDPELQASVQTARSSLSTLLREAGQLEESETLIRGVLDWRLQTLGARAPATLTSRHNLALVLYAKGALDAAESEERAALTLRREVLGETHAYTYASWQTLANILIGQNELDEAEQAARISMQGFEESAGEAHVQTLAAMNSLAYILEERKQTEAAAALYRRIIAIQGRSGSHHPTTFAARNNLAMLLLNAGKPQTATTELAKLVADATAAVGEKHLMTAIFSSNYGFSLTRAGDLTLAREVLESAHALLLQLVGDEHARTVTAAHRLADVYVRMNRPELAAALRGGNAP